MIRIGTAGWTIPAAHAGSFPEAGSHLARYAQKFSAVEINSSFYRTHKIATYERWAASVPGNFRFAVKIPKEITHDLKLVAIETSLDFFLGSIGGLGNRLGPLLVQLPPKLAYEETVANAFFALLRDRHAGAIVCEPRHASWFSHQANNLLVHYKIARVAADPAKLPDAATAGGWSDVLYRRLHGSPQIYYSPYSAEALDSIAGTIQQTAEKNIESWCVFDNTARGEAAGNALDLMRRLNQPLGGAK